MDYKTDDNTLTFADKAVIAFEYPINKVLRVSDVLIIVLDIPNNISHRRNVFAFDLAGDFLWQIQNIKLYYEGTWCNYVDAIINNENELILFNWCDTAVIIDPHTGNLVRRYVTK